MEDNVVNHFGDNPMEDHEENRGEEDEERDDILNALKQILEDMKVNDTKYSILSQLREDFDSL